MKKSYMTPMVVFSNASSATTFSTKCVYNGTTHAQYSCPVDMKEPDPFTGESWFIFNIGAGLGCTDQPEGGKVCYHAPTDETSIFAS